MLMNWLLGITSALAEAAEGGAAEAAEEISPAASMLQMVIPLLAMGLIFYFMLIRPQRKKDKQVKDMLASLKRGDRVTTIGGIYGTIETIKDDTITLVIGQKSGQTTEMTVARWAIRQVEEAGVENEGDIQV